MVFLSIKVDWIHHTCVVHSIKQPLQGPSFSGFLAVWSSQAAAVALRLAPVVLSLSVATLALGGGGALCGALSVDGAGAGGCWRGAGALLSTL